MNNQKTSKKIGRPRLPEGEKKERVVVFLPPDLIAWLEEQQEDKASIIEKAVRQKYQRSRKWKEMEMPVRSRKTLKSYLTQDEYQQITESAAKARLPVSKFCKRVCLAQEVRSTVDHQAVVTLAKANADMGRLGGLFKMILSEGNVGEYAGELRATLRSIEITKDTLLKDFQTVVKEFTKKKDIAS
ncbi:MAG: hypothetical protein P4L42_13855 [Desulfocapsaceae bacterium]|nr:hypothetical protein [Desulfocapsaceae bacterium]